MNTKVSITQQCLPPETSLMASECHRVLLCHFARVLGEGRGVGAVAGLSPKNRSVTRVENSHPGVTARPLLKGRCGPKVGGRAGSQGHGRGPSRLHCLPNPDGQISRSDIESP